MMEKSFSVTLNFFWSISTHGRNFCSKIINLKVIKSEAPGYSVCGPEFELHCLLSCVTVGKILKLLCLRLFLMLR